MAKPLAVLPADRLDALRRCAIKETTYGLEFDADSECYRAAFPAPHAAGRKAPEPVQPVPREKWPLSVRVVARLAKDGEPGVGTTLTRLIAGAGGETFKRLAASVGIDCGCAARAAALDARYPYES